jgi:hypothetical protein
MITNIYDLTGRHNMAQIYVDLAFGEVPRIDETRDIVADQYLVRDYDTPPLIASLQEIAGDAPVPVVIYTGKELSRSEERRLKKYEAAAQVFERLTAAPINS